MVTEAKRGKNTKRCQEFKILGRESQRRRIMNDNFVLVKGRHVLTVDENNEISRGENGGLLVYDNMNGKLSELPSSPEVLQFFDLPITINNTQEPKDKERMQMNDSYSDSTNSENNTSQLSAAVWNDNAVKLLFALYKDHQDDFKNTAIKNDVVWDKIKIRMTVNGYNFTRTQIKDKWTNMRKHYMRVKDSNKQTGAKRKTYRYYDEMDELYGSKPNVNPVAIASNLKRSHEVLQSIDEDQNILSSSSLEDNTTDNGQHKKKSKIERQLSSWIDKFVEHANDRENRREQRHTDRIMAIENATKTFQDMMQKLIDKF